MKSLVSLINERLKLCSNDDLKNLLTERLKLNKDTKINQIYDIKDIFSILEKRLSNTYTFKKFNPWKFEQGVCLKYGKIDDNEECFFVIWSDESLLSYFTVCLNKDNKISIGLVNEHRSSYGNSDMYFLDFVNPTKTLKTAEFKPFDITNNINGFIENIINMLNEGLKKGKSKNIDSIYMLFEDTYQKCKNFIKVIN